MYIRGVVGAAGVGTTASAVNIAATLRREGHHAAMLDLTGDVVDLFDVPVDATVADALAGDASAGDATARVEYLEEVTDELRDYYESLGPQQSTFRTGADDVEADPHEPEPGALPVVVGGDRGTFGEASSHELETVRADLEFAYDHVIADARTLGPAVATMVDDVIAVTDVQEENLLTAEQGIAACAEEGITVMGAVVNRAGHRTDISWLSNRLDTEILAVVPEDERTPEVEPVAHTAPDSPAGAAYDRLTDRVVEWDGDSGLVDGGPEGEVAADGEGEDDDGGFLSQIVKSWATGPDDDDGSQPPFRGM
jgi:MinD-like ATPase involved in chromosome partitioning or flagellar assembly